MVARNVNHPGAGRGQLQQLVNHLPMAVRKVGPALHGNQVDNVTHQIEGLALDVIQEIQQVVRLAIGGTQVNVGYEYAAILSHGASGEIRPAFRILESPWQGPVTSG